MPNSTSQDQAASAGAQPATPMQADPATAAQTMPPATPAPATETAQPTPSQSAQQAANQPATPPAATQDQVARAVNRDFGNYDKDSDGKLSEAEFDSWMGALRKASEPGFEAASPDGQKWLGQAFASSDLDKSNSVDKQELTTFLTPKAA